MAYTKHEWTTGETITATNLNHMEDGIASGGAMVVNFITPDEGTTWTADKTLSECVEAFKAGAVVTGIDSEKNVYHVTYFGDEPEGLDFFNYELSSSTKLRFRMFTWYVDGEQTVLEYTTGHTTAAVGN